MLTCALVLLLAAPATAHKAAGVRCGIAGIAWAGAGDGGDYWNVTVRLVNRRGKSTRVSGSWTTQDGNRLFAHKRVPPLSYKLVDRVVWTYSGEPRLDLDHCHRVRT